MNLNDKILKIWCEKYSKGNWTTKDGTSYYIEELGDNHLARIPYFLKKKHNLSSIYEIPRYIRREIEERDMILDPDTFYVTKKIIPIPAPKIEEVSDVSKSKPRTSRNKNLFNKLRR